MRSTILIPVLVFLATCGPAVDRKEKGEPAQDESPAIVPETPTGAERLDVYDEIGGDFALTDHLGRPFRLAQTHGKVRLLFFGYAMCPDVCPQTLSRVVRIYDLLQDRGDELLTLFISVDPERDTPEKLDAYLRYFELGETLALTGDRSEIDIVLDLFKAAYEKEETGSAASYLIHHTSYLFLIDREGTVRALFGVYEKPDEIAETIKALL